MYASPRPRRSALYVPGNNAKVLAKAKTLPADVLIFDLEDAVAPDAKLDARNRVCELLVGSNAYHPRETVVRVNGSDTEWHAKDLSAVVASGADGVLVPKVESAQQVVELVSALEKLKAPSALALWVMVETPAAFLRVEDIAAASDRLAALVVGTNDLVNDMHGRHTPGRAPISSALTMAVLAARAAGKVVLDGVFNAITDEAGFVAEAEHGRAMGFDGKTVIHPAQIGPANAAFGPSPTEVAFARRVVDSYERARLSGESVIVVEGRMIESLHVRDAQRILALEAMIAHNTGPAPHLV